jgi:AcrR family transcriptional regulator
VAVMAGGHDLTYRAVAAQAAVQERTVYRYFPTKAHLEDGLWNWILDHLTHADFAASNVDELVEATRKSFVGFDAGAQLIEAMLHSPQGLRVRLARQGERRRMFESCAEAAAPGLPAEARLRAAAALQVLYSAVSWDLLRHFWDMDAAQASAVVEQAIRAMLIGLRELSGDVPAPGGAGPKAARKARSAKQR